MNKKRRDGEPSLIPLNLIFDYPVHWSKYKVLRDLIQNFFDSVEQENWSRDFKYSFSHGQLIMESYGPGFDFNWLLYIGASTKRETPGKYAGYFGEGFKIASLCALRDHHWSIEVESNNWRLEVTTTEIEIEGRAIDSLAYLVWDNLSSLSTKTKMIISPFSSKDKDYFTSALYSFYYEDNPLFGEKIWESVHGAIYTRSKVEKPPYYPKTYEYDGKGIIFARYQAMGSFPLPLIFCSHNTGVSDRERSTFYRMDVISLIEKSTHYLPAEVARTLLIHLRKYWYSFPSKQYDFETWHGIVKQLAQSVGSSREQADLFMEQFPYLLVASPVHRREIMLSNRRKQALSWLRAKNQLRESKRYRLVQEGFSSIGYPSLEEVCEEEGGFVRLRRPEGRELELLEHLQDFTTTLFSDFFGLSQMPPCFVIENLESAWGGLSTIHPQKEKVMNQENLRIRYRLENVALKQHLFSASSFGRAIGTYLHELAHVFGGDQSASFSSALTFILEKIADSPELLALYQARWQETAKDGENERGY